ncbi:alpha/beta-hydrolase [Gymnopus androsaceus JB14]|uniref:Carboxylic ester hydrolase n=1 Tax=Gymnopus androsaceus JB14 TaxID=1447944 RepID=A0A6A4H5K8_9AGAR|nr:alpha/beta-hydrolase [Gymnopus androsaceus JB14]
MMLISNILLGLCFFAFSSTVDGQTTVELDYGTFIGVEDSSTNITSFLGVRYAEPPVGDLRWQAPVFPPTTQLGTVNASAYGNSCIPVPQSTVVSGTSEDCLFVNVFTPLGATSNSNLPIMVCLHGGGFQSGNSQVDAVPLMNASAGMIFVSIEYRLGQFGFLAGSTFAAANVSLNAGMLDQRTALMWIQRYISSFGGDPTQVTIWGESAGAGGIMFHLIANGGDQEGLFHAAMGDSVSLSYMPDCDSDYHSDIFALFAGFAGCSSSSDVMACLLAADADTLVSAGTQTVDNRTSTLYIWDPCADTGGTFLATRPVEAFASGAFAQVPGLFGSNTDEGANWSADLPNPDANTSEPNATETTVYNFVAGQYPTFTNDSFATAMELYPLADYNNSFSLQGQQMYGEARYICSGLMIAAAMSRVGLDAYHYHYNNPDQGSDHGSELIALFDPTSDFSGNDAALFVSMQEFWTSFVIAQSPIAASVSTWLPVTNSTSGGPRLLLQPGGIAMENVTDALSARCAFWHSLGAEIST